MYVCKHVCMYYVCMYVSMYACMHACNHVCMYICNVCVCIYIYIYVCVCVYMYVFTYHTCTQGQAIRRALLFQRKYLTTATGCLSTSTFKTTERDIKKIKRTRVKEEKKHNPEL